MLTPAFTIVPAYWVFSSVPNARELLGSVIMIAGVAIPVLERRAPLTAQNVDVQPATAD